MVDLSFEELDEIVGGLPQSGRTYQAHWATAGIPTAFSGMARRRPSSSLRSVSRLCPFRTTLLAFDADLVRVARVIGIELDPASGPQ